MKHLLLTLGLALAVTHFGVAHADEVKDSGGDIAIKSTYWAEGDLNFEGKLKRSGNDVANSECTLDLTARPTASKSKDDVVKGETLTKTAKCSVLADKFNGGKAIVDAQTAAVAAINFLSAEHKVTGKKDKKDKKDHGKSKDKLTAEEKKERKDKLLCQDDKYKDEDGKLVNDEDRAECLAKHLDDIMSDPDSKDKNMLSALQNAMKKICTPKKDESVCDAQFENDWGSNKMNAFMGGIKLQNELKAQNKLATDMITDFKANYDQQIKALELQRNDQAARELIQGFRDNYYENYNTGAAELAETIKSQQDVYRAMGQPAEAAKLEPLRLKYAKGSQAIDGTITELKTRYMLAAAKSGNTLTQAQASVLSGMDSIDSVDFGVLLKDVNGTTGTSNFVASRFGESTINRYNSQYNFSRFGSGNSNINLGDPNGSFVNTGTGQLAMRSAGLTNNSGIYNQNNGIPATTGNPFNRGNARI